MSEAVHVHRLRLQHPLPALPMAPQPWVEDALRCAAVPAAWRHRFVLVKRLQLRLGTRASGAALADALGARWQQLAAHALPAERAPEHATAVWFADEPAARLAWLRRRLQGAPLQAWFWRQVQPARGELADEVPALLLRPWREPVGAAREQAFREQLAALCAAHDLGLAGLEHSTTALAPGDYRPAEAAKPQVMPQQPLRVPRPAAAPSGSPEKALLGPAASLRKHAPSGPQAGPTSSEVHAPTRTAEPAASAELADAPHQPAPHARQGRPALAAAAQQAAASAPVLQAQQQAHLEAGLPTAWAGFFFVLNIWRLQLPDNAATALAWLHTLATWLRVPPDDGVAHLLHELGEPGAAPAAPLRRWRLQALQSTRLPLRRLLAAPGLVRASPTHVDLHLPLRSARLPVRKAGLDIDPGWQPLLLRVVAFHYDQGGRA